MTERTELAKQYLFNLNDKSQGILRNLVPGVSTRVFFGEHVMLSIVELEPNKAGKMHNHPEEQWGLCLEGEAVRSQDGAEFTVRPGDFWYTPGNMLHTMAAGPRGVKVLDIFGPPREEYKVPGEGYGPGEVQTKG
jgi:quercetin dioxygenase-like cupin family protein